LQGGKGTTLSVGTTDREREKGERQVDILFWRE